MGGRLPCATLLAAVVGSMWGCAATSEPCTCDDGPPPDTAAILAVVGGHRPTTGPATKPFVAGVLREAELAADAVTNYRRGDVTLAVIDGQLDAGNFAAAAELVGRTATSRSGRSTAIDHITMALSAAGQLDRAFNYQRVQRVRGSHRVNLALRAFAVGRARDGDVVGAVRAVGQVSELYWRAQTLVQVARLIPRSSLDAEAQGTLRDAIGACAAAINAAEPFDQVFALTCVAQSWFAVGNTAAGWDALRRAVAETDHVSGDYAAESRRKERCRIAVAYAEAGDFTAAMRLLDRVRHSEESWSDPADREEAFRDVARVDIRNGRLTRALDDAMRITEFTQYRWDALQDLASELASQGRFREALDVCGRIHEDSRRIQSQLTVAIAQAGQGDTAASARTAAAATFHQDPHASWGTLVFGRFFEDDPSTWVQPFGEASGSSMATIQIANEERADLVGVAVRLAVMLGRAPRLGSSRAASEIYASAAEAQASAGQPDVALSWARALADPGDRCTALVGVARGLTGHHCVADEN